MTTDPHALRRTVAAVAAANFAYFGVEGAAALAIGSASLLADSVDFLEDAALNVMILLALGLSLRARSRFGMAMALVMLAPAAGFLWTLWEKYQSPVPPEPAALTLVGLGAMAVNLGCAIALSRHRAQGGSLARAAFLSARNDVAANVAIVLAGLATAATASVWPDILVGLGIAAMNADAAHEVWTAARRERAEALTGPRA